MQYYGAFYRSALYPVLKRINGYLVRWLRKKYKRLRTFKKAHEAWGGPRPSTPVVRALEMGHAGTGGKGEKSPVTGDCHAGILREPGGEIPPGHPTRSVLRQASIGEREIRVHRRGVRGLPGIGRASTCRRSCRCAIWMEVSRSGFYEWRSAPESATAKRRGELAAVREEVIRGFR